ncbi:MAG: peptide ABC transporter substrate-binding protein [Phycisphaerales bacterium]
MGKLLVPFLLLLGVVGAAVVSDRPLPRADFTFINRGDVTTLDLQRMSWMQDFRMARLLFEGLVRQDIFTWEYRIIPGVAERWEVSPDGLTYTFHLRGDARWSNGRPVVAGEFLYAWRRALLPECGSDYIGQFQLIKGGKAFTDWRDGALAEFAARTDVPDREAAAAALWDRTLGKFGELVAAKAPDERTLVVTLERPAPYFLDLLAMPCFYPVYPPLVDEYESIDARTGQRKFGAGWTKPPALVGNGPFELKVWRFKRDMRLEKSPHYWNAVSLSIDTIDIPTVEDGNAAVLAYRSGVVDFTTDVTADYRAEIIAQKRRFYEEHAAEVASLRAEGLDPFEIDRRLPPDPRKHIHVVPAFGTYFYNFNCLPRLRDGRPNPFADARVRRAFAMALDRQAICDTVRRTGEGPIQTLIPPGAIAGYESPAGLAFNPAAARALLAEAGWAVGQASRPPPGGTPAPEFPTVEILFNKDSGHDKIAEAVGRMWSQHLGVPVRLAQREIKVFKENLKNGDYMVSRAGWYADYGDPLTFLDLSRTGDGNNDRKYSNPKYDALLDRANGERDAAKRLAILSEAERMLVEEELPMVPIFRYANFFLFDPDRISGISAHPRQDQQMNLVDVLGDGKGAERARVLPARPGSFTAEGAEDAEPGKAQN